MHIRTQGIYKIRVAKDGGFMIKQESGKVAFPDRHWKVPKEVKEGDIWHVEIQERPHLKVDFFKFIESEKGRIDKQLRKESGEAEELINSSDITQEEKVALLNMRDKDGNLPLSRVKNAFEKWAASKQLKEQSKKALEQYKQLFKEEPNTFPDPVPEDLKSRRFPLKFFRTLEVSYAWEGDGMRSGSNTRSDTRKMYVYKVEGAEPFNRHIPEKELSFWDKIKDESADWQSVYPSLDEARNEWKKLMRPYYIYQTWKNSLELIREIDGCYYFPIITYEGYPDIEMITLSTSYDDFLYFELGTWEDVEAFKNSTY